MQSRGSSRGLSVEAGQTRSLTRPGPAHQVAQMILVSASISRIHITPCVTARGAVREPLEVA